MQLTHWFLFKSTWRLQYMWRRWYSTIYWDFTHLCRVLKALLTPPSDHNYNLRDRLHNRQLADHMSHLTNYCNFKVRMLFCDSYWLIHSIHFPVFYRYQCTLRSGNIVLLIIRYDTQKLSVMKETFDLIWIWLHVNNIKHATVIKDDLVTC